MYKTHQAISYLKYWLDAMDRHSLQAPFIYDLYTQVICSKAQQHHLNYIEAERNKLKRNNNRISIDDFGSGSHVDNSKERRVSDIAKKGISKSKYSRMFVRLGEYLQAKQVLELGTSLGINTLYLSSIPEAHVTTFEGSSSLADLARNLFAINSRSNISVQDGDIDITLPKVLNNIYGIDLMFFDANHKYSSTVNYFNLCRKHVHEGSCFVFDDIHLSSQMEQAWQEISKDQMVTLSIDLFQVGLIFFNPELTKQHYVLGF